MTAPDFMPVLSAGQHSEPKQGACVMEYCSILAGEPFTDWPNCTHPDLTSAAQRTNDGLTDEHRHLIVPLIGRLMGTDGDLPPEWQGAYDEFRRRYRQLLDVADTVETDCYFTAVVNRSDAETLVGYLSALLDEYERLTGHKPRTVTDEELAALAAATA